MPVKSTQPSSRTVGVPKNVTATNAGAANKNTKKTLTPNATPGFSPFSLQYLQLTNNNSGKTTDINVDFREAINNVYLQKTIIGPSTLTIQLTDPNRKLIQNIKNGGIIEQGTTCTINENGKKINFQMVQFVKASDQIQLMFESQSIYRLKNQRGLITQTTSTEVTGFITKLATALNSNKNHFAKISVVAADYATTWSQLTGSSKKPIVKIGLGRGTTADNQEDSWTAMSRIASGIGWRLWEDENVIYFGPDEYWLGLLTKNGKGQAVPPVNKKFNKNAEIKVLREFGDTVQLIDYDWDVGKPFAQATVTCMMNNWQFNLGEIVQVKNLGPGSGYWMIAGMQRDLYNPQATLTLQVPMPFAAVYEPTSAPLPGFPLTTNKII
jgi:hypothetical protein